MYMMMELCPGALLVLQALIIITTRRADRRRESNVQLVISVSLVGIYK